MANYKIWLAPSSEKYKEKTKKRILKNIIIDLISDCWNWQKYKCGGYGYIGYNGGISVVHRVSYYLFIGAFDESLKVCHKCDNPSCVNPNHLFIGTQRDNMQDCISKKRFNRQKGRKGELNGNCKITDNQVLQISNRIRTGMKQTLIAKEFGVGDSTVSRIKRGFRLNKAEVS